MRLDELVPEWHFSERHSRDVVASTAAVMGAVEDVTWREVPLFRVLMSARSAGRAHVDIDLPVLDGMARSGFTILHRGDA
ncbi:MAG TPA: hypothetical protein VNA14_06415, partial [Mycobacteriales bacterium]|nr:hypothetical protein [Mycobacteriales bacterium]